MTTKKARLTISWNAHGDDCLSSTYAQKQRLTVDEFVETKRSSQHTAQRRELMERVEALQRGDRLIVSELSRLGRSLGQILHVIDRLIHKGVRLASIKESIRFEGKQNLQTKAMIVLFGLFAEIERDLIVERTKEGLAAARARGRRLGRPRGARGKSKLDGREDDIRTFLTKGVSKASIARIMEVSPTTLHHFRQDAETSGQNGFSAVTWRESRCLNNQNCSITIGYPTGGRRR